jgi:tetratricopeptide (TPR) repeat protein
MLRKSAMIFLRAFFSFSLVVFALQAYGQDKPVEPAPASSTSENTALDDFDAAMDLQIEAKDIKQRSKVIELLEQAIKKGLGEDDVKLAKQMLGASYLERAKLQIEEIRQARLSELVVKRLQKKIVDDLKAATSSDETLGEAYLLTAKLMATTDTDQARNALDSAIKNLGHDRERQGEAYAVRSLFRPSLDEKLADLKEALKLVPESIEVQRTLFALLLEKERFDEAFEIGKELLATNSKNPIALQATITALLQLDRKTEAIETINKLFEESPDEPTLLNLRGTVYLDSEKFDEAIADGTRLIEIKPGELSGYFLRAKSYIQRAEDNNATADSEDLRLARRDIDAALELQPNSVEGIRLRAAVASQQKRYDEAIQDTTLLAKNAPQEPVWLEHLATLYQLDDRPSLSIKIADQLVAMNKKNWRAYRIRGDAKLSIGDQAAAADDYKEALSTMEKNSRERSGLLNNLAWLLATSPEDALRDGQESVRLGTEACELTEYKEPHILSTLAAGYAEIGNFEEAKKWSNKAVELGATQSHDQLEQLQNERKSYEEGKPWREKQDVKEKKPPVIKADEAIET